MNEAFAVRAWNSFVNYVIMFIAYITEFMILSWILFNKIIDSFFVIKEFYQLLIIKAAKG